MELLYSNILPLRTTEHQRTIADCFGEQLMQADRVDIAVGYVSRASLEEIDHYDKQDNYISGDLRAPAFFLFCRRFVHNAAKSVILENFLPQIARFYLTLSLLGSIIRV